MFIATSTNVQDAGSTSRAPRTAAVGKCPVCGDVGRDLLFSTSDRHYNIAGVYTYRGCQKCQTVYQDPQVIGEDLNMCYPHQYYTHDASSNIEETTPAARYSAVRDLGRSGTARYFRATRENIRIAITNTMRRVPVRGFLGLIAKVLSSSRRLRERAFYDRVIDELLPRSPHSLTVLDVGCGAGRLMTALSDIGWEVTGVEWDPDAAVVARRTSGLSVFQGDFRDTHLPLGLYDLVSLSHVFEHIDDPSAALRRIVTLLRHGGRAVLTYPNPNSLGARIFRHNWSAWEPPRHLVLPSTKALVKLADANGLRVVSARTSARYAAPFFAVSRALRKSQSVDLRSVQIRFFDKLLAAFASTLVFLGVQSGEEVIAVLKRSDDLANQA